MAEHRFLGIAFAALGALGLGIWAASAWLKPGGLVAEHGVFLPQPRPLGDFTLTDHDGRALTHRDLQGRWTLVFTGFTHCPDICPTTLAVMAALERELAQRAPRLLFVSVDPARDTPERLREYVRYYSPTLIGATGVPEQLERLCAGLGVPYLAPPATEGSYTVDHSAALVLLNPAGEVAGYFQPPYQPAGLARDLARVLPS